MKPVRQRNKTVICNISSRNLDLLIYYSNTSVFHCRYCCACFSPTTIRKKTCIPLFKYYCQGNVSNIFTFINVRDIQTLLWSTSCFLYLRMNVYYVQDICVRLWLVSWHYVLEGSVAISLRCDMILFTMFKKITPLPVPAIALPNHVQF